MSLGTAFCGGDCLCGHGVLPPTASTPTASSPTRGQSPLDPQPLYWSCRFTRVIPGLRQPGHKAAWYRLEVAKRRLRYSLLHLGFPLTPKSDDPAHGLAYEFLYPVDAGD